MKKFLSLTISLVLTCCFFVSPVSAHESTFNHTLPDIETLKFLKTFWKSFKTNIQMPRRLQYTDTMKFPSQLFLKLHHSMLTKSAKQTKLQLNTML